MTQAPVDRSSTQGAPPRRSPPTASAPTGLLGILLRWRILHLRLYEYLRTDSWICKRLAAWTGFFAGLVLLRIGHRYRAFRVWTAIHRADYCGAVDRRILSRVKSPGLDADWEDVYRRHLDQALSATANAPYTAEPERLLGTRILVLKSPTGNEKGMIALDYSFTFPLFAGLFDVARIGKDYHLLLEPSWTGYCDLDILCYRSFPFSVYLQTYEPRDAEVVRQVGANLTPVPVAGNWWVDHRIMRPLPIAGKDVDVIMIAGWSPYKRHHRAFAALRELRRRGRKLKVVLVGYPVGLTAADIWQQAHHYGVADQLEMYERLTSPQVNEQLNRAKVNLLWSRKEGFNRAIIEGMFADVPGLMRRGHNYGYAYPFLNSQTGRLADERDLPEQMAAMVDSYERFSPRAWVMQHMTCQKATEVLEQTLSEQVAARGEPWTRGLAVKVVHLDRMDYWDPADRQRFAGDYEFLRTRRREKCKM